VLPRAHAGTSGTPGGGRLSHAGVEVLLVAATPMELAEVLEGLILEGECTVVGRPFWVGRRGDVPVAATLSGIGKANGAMATALALHTVPARWTLNLGIGGAYPGTGLDVGDLAVADAEAYGDEGVETAAGWQGLETTGFPLWEGEGLRWFNALPVDPATAAALAGAATGIASVAVGSFVTVSTVTGSAARAAELRERFHSLCETMEGAAVAHAALAAGSRFAEVRGISNRVGPRERAGWQLERAAGVAQRAALAWLDTLNRSTP